MAAHVFTATVFDHARISLKRFQAALRAQPAPNPQAEGMEEIVIPYEPELSRNMQNAVTHVLSYVFETARVGRSRIDRSEKLETGNQLLVYPAKHFAALNPHLARHMYEFSGMLKAGWRQIGGPDGPAYRRYFLRGGLEEWACPRVQALAETLAEEWRTTTGRDDLKVAGDWGQRALDAYVQISGNPNGQETVLRQMGAKPVISGPAL